jgi:putative (di)nucleoside polyphosphate hydrolase
MEYQTHRLTAGIVVDYQGKIFLGLSPRGYWAMPQGGIEPGETPGEAAARELYEETSMTEVEWSLVSQWYLITLPESARLNNKRYAKVHTQKYQWFLAKALTEPAVTLSEEYVQSKWVSPSEVMQIIAGSFKEDMYREVFREFNLL